MKFLLIFVLLLAGCGDSEQPGKPLEIEDYSISRVMNPIPQGDYAISDKGDGWLYFSNATRGIDISRFRIKGKPTAWEDFDVENPPYKTSPKPVDEEDIESPYGHVRYPFTFYSFIEHRKNLKWERSPNSRWMRKVMKR